MKRASGIFLLAAALSGCAGALDFTKVVTAPAPQGMAGIWTTTTSQKSLVSPKAVASLIISRSGTTLDCRYWERTIVRPGKLTLRSGTLFNINNINEINKVTVNGDEMHYGRLTLHRMSALPEACQSYINRIGDDYVLVSKPAEVKSPSASKAHKRSSVERSDHK